MNKIIITIDGYASCGKSTLAKHLAKELNYLFIDSGAMYRAITFYFLNNNIDFNNKDKVLNALQNINLSFKYNDEYGSSDILLNGENIEATIREMWVNERVSEVAAIEAVRTFTVAQQQQYAINKGIVMDGRDIGTVVFPDAELKIFLTAQPHIRVERRYEELKRKGKEVSKEEIKKNLESRDYMDTHRAISPLRKAEDAVTLDNTNLNLQEQKELVLGWANKIIAKN